MALTLRWWWSLYTKPTSLWTTFITRLYRIGPQPGPCLWAVQGSFFWKGLRKLKLIFHWSAFWNIGDGSCISLWYDSWSDLPLIDSDRTWPRSPHHRISLKNALPALQHLVPGMNAIVEPDTADVLYWRWNAKGEYTTKSTYVVLVGGGRMTWSYMAAWHSKAPPTVKVFAQLLLRDKILSREVLMRRGMNCETRCVMCEVEQMETSVHLLFHCSYAKRVWETLSNKLRVKLATPEETPHNTWRTSWDKAKQSNGMSKCKWATMFLCSCWMIWKQRNELIFRGSRMQPQLLVGKIIQEVFMWLDNG